MKINEFLWEEPGLPPEDLEALLPKIIQPKDKKHESEKPFGED